MAIVEYFRPHFQRLHGALEEALQDLTPEQLNWRPGGSTNSIAFTIWHYTRTEDNVVRFVLQDRRPTVWLEGGWNEKFGLDRIAQGTGMSHEEADMRLPSVQEFVPYMHEVWRTTEEYLASLTDDGLESRVTVRPLGERSVGQLLLETLLTHGFSHLGETWVLRGLQGLRGSSL